MVVVNITVCAFYRPNFAEMAEKWWWTYCICVCVGGDIPTIQPPSSIPGPSPFYLPSSSPHPLPYPDMVGRHSGWVGDDILPPPCLPDRMGLCLLVLPPPDHATPPACHLGWTTPTLLMCPDLPPSPTPLPPVPTCPHPHLPRLEQFNPIQHMPHWLSLKLWKTVYIGLENR